jgi:polysaccharide deacetylase 2 family uncharacterized protein YibQ
MPPKRPRSDKSPGKSPGKGQGKSPSSRSRSAKPARKGKAPFGWRLHLALAVTTLILIGLVWLARRDEQRPQPPPPAAVASDPLPMAREQVEAFLAGIGAPAESITREPPEAPRNYRIRQRAPKAGPVDALRRKLRKLTPPLVLGTPEDGVLNLSEGSGKLLLSIQFLPTLPPPAGKPLALGKRGRVAIIMDDLGRSLPQARKLLALAQPVTLAILPGEPYAAAVAAAAHSAGREVMLHAPMEPQGYPVVDPGDDALLLSQSEAEVRESTLALLTRVPHAVGVNNHMGSRFTEDERGMGVVMRVLKEHNLFFVDSLTSSHSVGSRAAESAGVASLRRDLFLDNVAEVRAIVREIERLAEKARRNGSAVGICHPYPETFAALRQELPRLEREGVEFVKVSELLARR